MGSTQTATQVVEAKAAAKLPQNVLIPSTLKYRPLPQPLETATDTSVPSVFRTVEAPGGYPCRKCLQDGKPGEKMELLSYDPFLGDSPYRQFGPIFVHSEPKCEKAEFPQGSFLPEQQRKRELSLRAFNQDHMMVGFDLVDGERLLERTQELMEQEGNARAEYVHVHYPGPGCFAVRIDRA